MGARTRPSRSCPDRSSSILHRRDWHSNFGNVLLAAQRRLESIEAYKQAVALDPAHAAALTNLGAVLALEGDG